MILIQFITKISTDVGAKFVLCGPLIGLAKFTNYRFILGYKQFISLLVKLFEFRISKQYNFYTEFRNFEGEKLHYSFGQK